MWYELPTSFIATVTNLSTLSEVNETPFKRASLFSHCKSNNGPRASRAREAWLARFLSALTLYLLFSILYNFFIKDSSLLERKNFLRGKGYDFANLIRFCFDKPF